MPRLLNEQKFCGWCGSKVVKKQQWMTECSSCIYRNYINPNPCSSLVITRGDQVLMVRRSIQPQAGKYDLPGGFMDMTDKSMEECVYREMKEELGISATDVTKIKYLESVQAPDYIWDDTVIRNVGFYYVAELIDKDHQIKLDTTENSEIIWITKDGLSNIDFAWDTDKLMLTKYFERRS